VSYQVIARKWRPQSFDEVTGQSHVTTPLRNAIRTDRVPHAILLTGPRGCGKTTIARILARCLNCEKGPTDSPCGSCTSCHEIASGSSTDVQEIDAASRTGVDDVRELIEAIRYAPSPGKHRIFVVDEVHMLSTAAFNALLKTLEEPPPRSLFVFATTNPEKIPFTVISRCQRYDLRLFSTAEVAARLSEISKAEGIEISETSLLAIAREGGGSMRDSQTLLDQVIAYGGTTVGDEAVASVLDLVDSRILLGILEACIDGDPVRALEACAHAKEAGTDPKRLSATLVQALRDLVVLRIAPESNELVEGGEAEIAELRAVAERAEEPRLRRMFRALIKEQEDLAWAPQPYAVLEMALVRLATMPAGDDVAQLLGRLDQLEKQLASGGTGGAGGGGSAPKAGGGAPQKRPQASASTRGEAAPKRADGPAPERASGSQPTAAPNLSSEPTPAPPQPGEATAESHSASSPAGPDGPPAAAAGQAGASPAVVMDRLRVVGQQRDRGLFASLEGAQLQEQRAGYVKIGVMGDFHTKRLQSRDGEMTALCSDFFGEPTRVEISQIRSNESAAGPAADARPSSRERDRQIRKEALNHPGVNAALEILEAELVEIRPLGGE
jgi:DNA polymerase-3 subunit gamma/tau